MLEALLWAFHNAKSGLRFPSYEAIAEAAGCARSTVAEAIKAFEDAGILSWVQRIKRVREACPDLLGDDGWRWRPKDVERLQFQATPARLILLSPKSRLEPRTKGFSLPWGPPPAAKGPPVPGGKGLCEEKEAEGRRLKGQSAMLLAHKRR